MINLLPPLQLQILRQRRHNTILTIWVMVLALFLIAQGLTLLAINIWLAGEQMVVKTLTDQAKEQSQKQSYLAASNKLAELKQAADQILSFYPNQAQLALTLERISQALPQGSYLFSLSFDSSSQLFTLTGFTPQRQDLLRFKQQLERVGDFTEVEFPASNWVKSENIDFFVTFKAGLNKP